MKPGPEGGFGGREVCISDEFHKLSSLNHRDFDPRYTEVPDAHHLQLAETLLFRLKLFANRHRVGKAVVKEGIPNELYRVILKPYWVLRNIQHPGVGVASKFVVPPCLHRRLVLFYAKILANRMAPLKWHIAYAFTVPKNPLIFGVKSERLVAAMDIWGRAFFRAVLDGPLYVDAAGSSLDYDTVRKSVLASFKDPSPPTLAAEWQFGGLAFRRREEAFLVQAIMSYNITVAKLYSVTTFHDGVNAFWSADARQLETACAPPFVATEAEHHFVKQRLAYAAVCLGASSADETHLILSSGIIPGDHSAPRCFNRLMQYPGSIAVRKYRRSEPLKDYLTLKCFLYDAPSLATLSGFMDDMATKAVGRCADSTWRAKQLSDAFPHEELLNIGIHSNQAKEENVAEGPKQSELRRLHQLLPHATVDARYLGMRHVPLQSCSVEVQYRLAAVTRAWAALRAFFKAVGVDISLKLMVYRATIFNTALTGMEPAIGHKAPLGRSDVEPLQKFINRTLRTTLGGEATDKRIETSADGTEVTSYTAISNFQLHLRCRVVPLYLELRVRRLLWLFSMLRHVEYHELTLAALFANLAACPDAIGSDGGLVPGRAHPWLKQVQTDLFCLDVLDDGDELIEQFKLPDGRLNLRDLLTVGRPELLAIDPHRVRLRFLSTSIPPQQPSGPHGPRARR